MEDSNCHSCCACSTKDATHSATFSVTKRPKQHRAEHQLTSMKVIGNRMMGNARRVLGK